MQKSILTTSFFFFQVTTRSSVKHVSRNSVPLLAVNVLWKRFIFVTFHY